MTIVDRIHPTIHIEVYTILHPHRTHRRHGSRYNFSALWGLPIRALCLFLSLYLMFSNAYCPLGVGGGDGLPEQAHQGLPLQRGARGTAAAGRQVGDHLVP